MKHYFAVTEEELAISLREGGTPSTISELERALVEPYGFSRVYGHQCGDPAGFIMRAGSGNLPLLRDLIAERIVSVSLRSLLVKDVDLRITRFLRANTLFQLACDLFKEQPTDDKQRVAVVRVLEKVWKNHAAWRQATKDTFYTEGELYSWVDPATSAEESLLIMKPKTCQELEQRAKEIVLENERGYPDPMSDYALHTHILYAVEQYRQSADVRWASTACNILQQCINAWYQRHRYLLEFTLIYALDIVRGDENKETEILAHLETACLTCLQMEEWDGLKKYVQECIGRFQPKAAA